LDNNIKKMLFDNLFLGSIVATTTMKILWVFSEKKCIPTTADELECALGPKGLLQK